MARRRPLGLIWLLACLVSQALAAPPAPVPSLMAEYRLSRGDLEIGQVSVTLETSPDGGYMYESRTRPTGLVALFRQDEVLEHSEGRWNGQSYVPERYRYRHRNPDGAREVTIDFDWAAGRAVHKVGDSVWTLALPEGTQDKLGQQLALMEALSRGERRLSLRVADGGGLRTYRYEPQGYERVRTPGGEFLARKLVRYKDDLPSQLTLWSAPRLGFLAVRIDRREQDQIYRMELSRIEGPQRSP
jgi:hypothetical protein